MTMTRGVMFNSTVQKMIFSVMLVFIGFSSAHANAFKVGETILVGFPANNIKDDAYIIGIIRKQTKDGNYQISVRDFVEGHDYGLSCVPIAVDSSGKETGQSGWEMWDDTRQLTTQGLEYIVPAEKLMKLKSGQFNFIERYNIYITYSRWKSNAPVLSVDRLETAKVEAENARISQIIPAFDIAILDRESYFDPHNGRPYLSYESVPKLTIVMTHIQKTLKNDSKLNQLWRAKKRDWKVIEESMERYFLIDAIDKSVDEAFFLLNEDDIEKADPKALALLKKQLKALGKKV